MTFPYQFTYYLLRYCFLPVLKCFFSFEVHGFEHVKRLKHGAIIAGNHTGYLDSALVLAAYPHIFRFLSREEVLSWRFVGPWVKRANTVILPSKQHKATLKFLIDELKQGKHFCIFPEGRLSQTGEFSDFKDGVAFLQQKSGVPVIPFAIHGGYESWPEGQRFPKLRKITLAFGQPIPVRKERSEMTHLLRQAIRQMKQHLQGLERLEKNRKKPFHQDDKPSPRERMIATLAIDHHLHVAVPFL